MLTALMENTLAIIDGIMILCAFLNEKIQDSLLATKHSLKRRELFENYNK